MDGAGGEPRPTSESPRRALVTAAILVVLLVLAGLAVSQGLLDMSRLQDCAATGRRDC